MVQIHQLERKAGVFDRRAQQLHQQLELLKVDAPLLVSQQRLLDRRAHGRDLLLGREREPRREHRPQERLGRDERIRTRARGEPLEERLCGVLLIQVALVRLQSGRSQQHNSNKAMMNGKTIQLCVLQSTENEAQNNNTNTSTAHLSFH